MQQQYSYIKVPIQCCSTLRKVPLLQYEWNSDLVPDDYKIIFWLNYPLRGLNGSFVFNIILNCSNHKIGMGSTWYLLKIGSSGRCSY